MWVVNCLPLFPDDAEIVRPRDAVCPTVKRLSALPTYQHFLGLLHVGNEESNLKNIRHEKIAQNKVKQDPPLYPDWRQSLPLNSTLPSRATGNPSSGKQHVLSDSPCRRRRGNRTLAHGRLTAPRAFNSCAVTDKLLHLLAFPP